MPAKSFTILPLKLTILKVKTNYRSRTNVKCELLAIEEDTGMAWKSVRDKGLQTAKYFNPDNRKEKVLLPKT